MSKKMIARGATASHPEKAESLFGRVELTDEEKWRRAREAGAVKPEDDLARKNEIIAGLAAELQEATEWERRAEAEYRQAMEKRVKCFDILERAVMEFRRGDTRRTTPSRPENMLATPSRPENK